MKRNSRRTKTSKSFKEQHEILGGKGVVYRTTQNGDFWQFRTWIPEEKKYFRRSLKTRDFSTALRRGEEECFEIWARLKNGTKIFGITWNELVEEYLKFQRQRVASGKIVSGRLTTIKSQLKHLLEFVGKNRKLNEFDEREFENYAKFRRSNGVGAQEVTIRNEHATINSLIKFGYKKGYLHYQSGEFEEIRIRGDAIGRRPSFDPEEIKKIYGSLYTWAKDYSDEKEKWEKRAVTTFIYVALQSFGRFGELRQLKWKNVKFRDKEDESGQIQQIADITIRAETSKVRKTRVVPMVAGVALKSLRKYSPHDGVDDYVFCNFKNGSMLSKKTYYRLWGSFLEHADLAPERKLTYYSLRHCGITASILSGSSLEHIASLAGTSFINIHNHYSHIDNRKLTSAQLKLSDIYMKGVPI